MTGAIIFLHKSLIVITSYFAITSFIHAVKFRKSKPKIKNSNSLVIRQKGKSQIGYFKKTKLAKFSEIRTFLTPWYADVRVCIRVHICTCVYQGIRNVRFSENLACYVFLKQPSWDSPFCLITDELRKEGIFMA